PVQATPAAAPSSGGSHAAPAPGGPEAPARPVPEADPAPTGLDRSYGVTLPPEEVAKLIEARGGHPPRPQDEPRG
ncbi:hypothetical protein H7J95_05755, partial [Micrococcus luteus]|nr:hypothetical protein [Micrococcus luteus]